MKPRDKFYPLYLNLKKTHGNQIRQSSRLIWDTPTLKTKLSFDHMTNVSSGDILRKIYIRFHKTYDH